MNQTFFLIVIFILFLLILWGNMMYRKAVKSLAPDKQIDLSEVQRSYQFWTIGLVLGAIALFFVLQKYSQIPYLTVAIGFVGLVLVMYGYIAFITYRKMKNLDFEASFLKSYIMANGLRLLAILLLLLVVLLKEMVFKQ
jgi:Na+/H+ antiporter NhaC